MEEAAGSLLSCNGRDTLKSVEQVPPHCVGQRSGLTCSIGVPVVLGRECGRDSPSGN